MIKLSEIREAHSFLQDAYRGTLDPFSPEGWQAHMLVIRALPALLEAVTHILLHEDFGYCYKARELLMQAGIEVDS